MERFNQDSSLLLKTAIDSGITDPEELGCILGNASVETKQYSTMHEDFRYRSVDRLLRAVSSAKERYTRQQIQDAIDSKDPVRIATVMYEGRNTGDGGLGNSEPGDGWRFHGRGFFQYTGRENYTKFGKMFDVDLVNNPDIAAEPVMAAKLAVAYWKERVPEHSRRNAVASGMKINGGDNGEIARFAASERWKKTITPQLVQDIQTGKITLDQLSFHGWQSLKDGVLRLGERGMEIRELQYNLNKLGITDAKGRELAPNGTFDNATKEATESFQRQLGIPVGKSVNADMIKAVEFYAGAPEILRKSLQPKHQPAQPELSDALQDQKDHLPLGAPPSYRNDWLERDPNGVPNYLHTPVTPTPNAADRIGLAPAHEAYRRVGERSIGVSGPGGKPEPDGFEQPEPTQPRPQRDAPVIHTGHRDYALFEAIRRQLPNEYSDDMAAHVMLQTKQGGITRPDQIGGMGVENGRMVVMGKSGVDWAIVELDARAPAMQETLSQSHAFDQQQVQQHEQWLVQEAQLSQGRGMSRSL